MERDNTTGIILMAKPPEAGESKTRLSLDVGDARAMELYVALLNQCLSAIGPAPFDGKFVYTYGREFTSQMTANGFTVINDIGPYRLPEKVEHAFHESFMTVDRAIMVVADDFFMNSFTLHAALSGVRQGQVLLGPTVDGGLYLIGISKHQSDIVVGLPFGKPDLADELIRRAIKCRYPLRVLDRHIDIDSEHHLDMARRWKPYSPA